MGRKNLTNKKKGGAKSNKSKSRSRSKSRSKSRSRSRRTPIPNLEMENVDYLSMEVSRNTQSILQLIDEINVIKRKISDAERRTYERLKGKPILEVS
jgi:hypothetical protein